MRPSAIEFLESRQVRKDVPEFRTGDTVRVYWKVREGEKEREQPFEGVVIRKTRGKSSATFTVRKVSYGVGVERIFPLHSPRYSKIEIVQKGSVARNRLFYLRNLRGKASRVDQQEEAEAPAGAPAKAEGKVEAKVEAAAASEPKAAKPKKEKAAKPAGEKPAKK